MEKVENEEVVPEDIQGILDSISELKTKTELLSEINKAVKLGAELHDKEAPNKMGGLSCGQALDILSVLGEIVRQQVQIYGSFGHDPKLQESSLKILENISEAHSKILSHVNK